MKTSTLNILALISLLIGIILLIWKVFGNGPTDLLVLTPFIFTMLFKLWSISSEVAYSKGKFKGLERSFVSLASDFKEHVKHRK